LLPLAVCRLARQFAERPRAEPRIQILNDVVLTKCWYE
jgi:hypothetical protein